MLKKLYLPVLILLLSVSGVFSQQTFDELQNHARKGYELFDAGRYRSAAEELSKAKRHITSDTPGEAMRIDYYLAECAARTSDRNAMEKLEAFIYNYPGSIYGNDANFAIANLFYSEGDYTSARRQYQKVNQYELRTSQQDEYNFKSGHSYFSEDNYTKASESLKLVNRSGEYGVHTRYYLAYMDYASGEYAAAKREFQQLASEPAYEKVIPFYLLQIEFLEGNYDYVLQHGPLLMASAQDHRETEIARIVGEAYFHQGNYAEALRYMNHYRTTGGQMGRAENYLVGYSLYMRNDLAEAIESLSKVAGPDDKLTQNAAYHLGGAYLRTGDKHKAMQSFSMASGTDYDPAVKEDALFNYGKLQYELGGGVFNEAINILSRYLAEYPSSTRATQAREFLIAAYYNSKNYEAAYEAIKLVPNPDNNLRAAFQKIAYFRALEYYNDGNLDTAYSMLEESLRNRFTSKYTALTQFWKAEILYRRGNYNQAIPLYKEYLQIAPATEQEYSMAQYNLGYSYFNLKQYTEARTWFERFLSSHRTQDSYRADAYNRTGDSQYAQREFSKALTSYDAAAKIGTDEKYYAGYQRAMTLGLTSGNSSKIDALRTIVSAGQGPYVDDAMYELGRTYISAERFSDATSILKRYINEHPQGEYYLSALSDLGLAYQNLNDNRNALTYYKTLVDKAPASQQARDAMLAVKGIYVDMNDVDGYFAFAQKSGIETDTGIVARDSLSFVAAERLHMTSSSRDAIIGSWKDYLQKFPRGAYRPNALYYLSDTYVASGQTENAITTLKELSDMGYNSFTVRGLERLAPLAFNQKRYNDAADAYKKLASASVNPQTAGNAWGGYLRSIKAADPGNSNAIMSAADDILAAPGVPANVVREAKFAKAHILDSWNEHSQALIIYRELATESQTAEGAESTYHVIESMFASNDLNGAEKKILEFASQNTPHSYWLGKAFLTLGDVYIKKGDSFQARATLQSIVDGYSPANDGIIDAAKERIAKLGN